MNTIIFEIVIFLIAIVGGDWLMRFMKFALKIRLKSEQSDGKSSSMKLSIAIGYIERALIFILAFNGHPETIGWIFAAKSIARFKELENRRFTEYYLIGTLTSIFWALLCAIAGKNLIAYLSTTA